MREAILAVVASRLPTALQKRMYDVLTDYPSFDEAFRSMDQIPDLEQRVGEAERLIETGSKEGIGLVEVSNIRYPVLVKEIFEPPFVLWIKSSGGADNVVDLTVAPMVAIVGARNCSTYGADIAREIASEVAKAGVVVVSGLAYGIDAASHEGAVKAGITHAVLGHGLNFLCPAKHRPLANKILECGGALISQFAPADTALPARFLERNRVIAALCKATIVVEAAARSGSLSTARFAIDEGRDVFAVPGRVSDARCEGSNKLIQSGSSVLLSAEDVLTSIGSIQANNRAVGTTTTTASLTASGRLNKLQASLLAAVIQESPVSIDDIARRLTVSSAEINQEVLALEIEGYIRRLPGNFLEIPHKCV